MAKRIWIFLFCTAALLGLAGCTGLAGGIAVEAAPALERLVAPTLPPVPTVPTLPPPSATPVPTATATPPVPTPRPTWTPIPTATPNLTQPGGFYSQPLDSALQPTPAPTFQLTQPVYAEGPFVIGYSTEGRPIEAYRFGTGPIRRMIVAGIHGGSEYNTIALIDQFVALLQSDLDFIPDTVTLYIVRNLNPDGYARAPGSIEGRTNANGVDLNRNFPTHWQPEWERDGCWNLLPTTGGSGPGSEAETQALMAFVNEVRPTALISYHSAALGILPADSAEELGVRHADSVRLAEALAAVSTYPYPPLDTGCVYTGTLADWAASAGAAAVDFELHTRDATDYEEQVEVLRAFLAWRR